MDVNGTRFHLLLGENDWGRCRVARDDTDEPLLKVWDDRRNGREGMDASPPVEPVPFDWDSAYNELTLRRKGEKFVAAPVDQPVRIENRRGVAADRYGNIYWIDGTRTKVLVLSVGTDNVSEFWPSDLNLPPTDHGDFADAQPPAALGQRLAGVAVTEDHYLVVGSSEPAGLLVFDLMAGGPPFEMRWPASFDPIDMAARRGCGVWILDGAHRYWGLDRRFGVVTANQPGVEIVPPEIADFQPATSGDKRQRPAVFFPEGIPLDGGSPIEALDPVAIEALPGGEVLILDRGAAGSPSRVLCYKNGRRLAAADVLQRDGTQTRDARAHDFVFVPSTTGDNKVGRLLIASSEGNQAFAYDVLIGEDRFELITLTDFNPLRRFAGKGLVLGKGFVSPNQDVACANPNPVSTTRDQVFYDFGDTWIPLIRQTRPRYDEAAELITPPFDASEPQCVWHRLALDAVIPPDTGVEIFSRTAEVVVNQHTDEEAVVGEWQREPDLYLRGSGSELPWARPWQTLPSGTKPPDGDGTWELLFQNARGRFLQLKLVLHGNGRATPRLRALRAWFPRFSYLEHYFPGVYREDTTSASFFERFLANFEGYYTALEDKIATMQALFDVRSAPPDVLDWLADWFAVAIDPAWDERRRRLFIRHAMDFFQYRGTVHGLKMALHLAFDPKINEDDLGPPVFDQTSLADIRIVENYLLRRASSVVFGEPEELTGPRLVAMTADWTPAEGNAGLVRRYATLRGAQPSPGAEAIPFSLMPPDAAAEAVQWRAFVVAELGFDPSGGWQDRDRWQKYLASHYDLKTLNTRHGAAYTKFTEIPLPDDEPTKPRLKDDWLAFMADTANDSEALERIRWQDFLAQRYRRVKPLNAQYNTNWSSFSWIPLPDRLPNDGVPLNDWLQFQLRVKPMYAVAHTFRVLLPTPAGGIDPITAKARMDLAQRIVDLEKPAHTVFDVRFYWAMFRIGDARLGTDTLLDQGSRAPQLIPDTVLGRSFVGTSFVAAAEPKSEPGRTVLLC